MSWLLKSWSWLRLNWKWVIFPVGVALFLASYYTRKKPEVITPETVGASAAEIEAKAKAEAEAKAAKEELDRKIKEVTDRHAEVISKLTDEQQAKLTELKEDPDKLNEFLLGVGREIRG